MRIEPAWWARARAMKANGVPQFRIARRLGKTKSAVSYCLNEAVRAKAIANTKARWAALVEIGGSSSGRRYDRERQKLRRNARDQCREQGSCTPDALRAVYQQFGCL